MATQPDPGSDEDTRLYAVSGGAYKLHILQGDYVWGTLCGVWRNLGDARDYPELEFRGRYRLCKKCLAVEAAGQEEEER